MQYRKLGHTDTDVSVICLGAMTWGEQNTQAEAFEQMDYALARGVNFFDTAELYPIPPKAGTYERTEEIIGHWLQQTVSTSSCDSLERLQCAERCLPRITFQCLLTRKLTFGIDISGAAKCPKPTLIACKTVTNASQQSHSRGGARMTLTYPLETTGREQWVSFRLTRTYRPR